MKNKLRIMLLASIFAAVALSGAALAWLSYTADPVMNIFKAGTVDITLYDKLGEAEFPSDGIGNVNPGDFYDKEVYVVSNGSKETYVRVKLTPLWTPPRGYEGDELDPDVVSLNIDTANWVLGEDGWYYYKHILTAQNTNTTKLLDGITFSGPLMDNKYQEATLSIDVEAQAVQASH
ncbi:MAG: hypothetical protein AAGU14_10750, partial [Eubacteriaceae bacterium]